MDARGRLWLASVPLGPALEGIGPQCGRMAGPGSITRFEVSPLGLACHSVDGPLAAGADVQGISATGYLSLLALLLRLGCLDADGHFRTPASPLARRVAPPPQQARTGLRLPLPYGQWLAAADVACLALAGALGEHCPPACLEELGFLPSGMGRRVRAVGNSSLDGAALLAAEPWRLPALARWCAAATLVPVAEDPGFHADYLRHMRFGV